MKELAEQSMISDTQHLIDLFKAYRNRDDFTFSRIAEAIISEELTANRHDEARELRRALNGLEKKRPVRNRESLTVVPRDNRNGDSLLTIVEPKTDFSEVVLHTETRKSISRILDEHRSRMKLASFGYRPKNKLIFWGPPGCGKTLTAHLIASELKLPLGIVRLDSAITSYLGETASNIRRIFDLAQARPFVLFLDEADAISKDRSDAQDVGELKRVVNSLLQAIDSFTSTESVFIAATNHQYMFDMALWRRFDDIVSFPKPAYDQIQSFLNRLLNGVKINGSIETVAKSCSGLSFAEIEKGAIEVIKTMVLDDRIEIRSIDLSRQFKRQKQILRRVKQPRQIE